MGFEKEAPITIPEGEGLEDAIDAFAEDVYAKKPEASNGNVAVELTATEKAEAAVIKEQEMQEIAERQKAVEMKMKEEQSIAAEKALKDEQESEKRVQEIIKGLEANGVVDVGDDLTPLGNDEQSITDTVDGEIEDLTPLGNEEQSVTDTVDEEIEDLTV